MPKRKSKTKAIKPGSKKSTATRKPRATKAKSAPVPAIEVDEQPIGGATVLALESEQPLLGTFSGASWDYVPDPQVVDVLAETERVQTASAELADELHNHHSKSPELSGGDIDADWERADQVGEETVGGTVATPDQDRVDELGQAVGLVYQDEEPLHTEDKLQKRDRERWELNPASRRDG